MWKLHRSLHCPANHARSPTHSYTPSSCIPTFFATCSVYQPHSLPSFSKSRRTFKLPPFSTLTTALTYTLLNPHSAVRLTLSTAPTASVANPQCQADGRNKYASSRRCADGEKEGGREREAEVRERRVKRPMKRAEDVSWRRYAMRYDFPESGVEGVGNISFIAISVSSGVLDWPR
jgi:hypothetical protein